MHKNLSSKSVKYFLFLFLFSFLAVGLMSCKPPVKPAVKLVETKPLQPKVQAFVPAPTPAASAPTPITASTTPVPVIHYDVIINNGRVIDPETNLDDIRHIGIVNGKIKTISKTPLTGTEKTKIIDATNLVVAPGFIDMNNHGSDELNYDTTALDGVTTSLELEIGTTEVDRWYSMRHNHVRVNYGVSVSHPLARAAIFEDPTAERLLKAFGRKKLFLTSHYFPTSVGVTQQATDKQTTYILRLLQEGIDQGALGIGSTLGQTPGATTKEFTEVSKLAARNSVGLYAHGRFTSMVEPNSSYFSLEELIANAAMTGAQMHLCHINMTGLNEALKILALLKNAQSRNLAISTDATPYIQIILNSNDPVFQQDWQNILGITYSDLMLAETGEVLTKTNFEKIQKNNSDKNNKNNIGSELAVKIISQSVLDQVIADPVTVIASDGQLIQNDKIITGHPAMSSTFAKILREYVREKKLLSLSDAISKMTFLPASLLEKTVPSLKTKGRLQVDADADITIFDPNTVTDKADFKNPSQAPVGFRHVLVNGIPVISEGILVQNIFPGQPVRNPTKL